MRGTLVHAVLERLFGLPAAERSPQVAKSLVQPLWNELCAQVPGLVDELFTGADDPELSDWLASVDPLLDTYFQLEDPRRIEPAARELLVETELASGVLLRGYLDRLDITPDGKIRIVDYKTGATPGPGTEGQALFQMKCYALAVLRLRGVVPAQLCLLYLAAGEVLSYTPDEAELLRFERILLAIWEAILAAGHTGEFQPNRGAHCTWCPHRSRCPSWGGEPPPYPGWPRDGDTDTAPLRPADPTSTPPPGRNGYRW